MYFLQVSSHTIFYDENEKFILTAFKNLTQTEIEKKDIRFKLLNKQSKHFIDRAKWFTGYLNRIEAPNRCSYEEYIRRCDQIVQDIKTIFPQAKIEFYDRSPIWRIGIFDETLFVSTYETGIEGHMTNIFQFYNKNPMYNGFLSYFNM